MKKFLSLLLFVIAISLQAASPTLRNDNSLTKKDVINAYVYLLSRYLVIRQEARDIAEDGVDYNIIKYNETGKADFVNPNLDVAYMEAWFAVDENSAVILNVPKIEGRYYTVQLLDGWGEVIANINEVKFPKHPYGKFALCLKDTKADIPKDAYKIILPAKKVKMLARVELQDDWAGAEKLQKAFTAQVVGKPAIAPVVAIEPFTNKKLITVGVFKSIDKALRYPDSMNPQAAKMQELAKKVAVYVKSSPDNEAEVAKIVQNEGVPAFVRFATTKAGKFKNNWLGVIKAGNYDGDYWTRSSANFVGIWANSSDEVVYYVGTLDADGKPYVGGTDYRLHFTKEQLPMRNVNSFWSIILVDFPGYRVVKNPLNRYNFNNYSKFHYDKDGGLTLYIGTEYKKAWPKSNYLPSPTSPKERFSLTLRMYVPKPNVLSGEWFPPAVEKIKQERK